MKQIILCVSFLTLTSCSSELNNSEIKKYGWKYGTGYHISDVLSFDEQLALINDTLFLNKKAIAKVYKCYRRIDNSEVLEIKSIDNDSIGIYYAKWLEKSR